MASRTILFIEDDLFVLTMYRSRLQNAGFQVEAAEDGLAGIDLLSRMRPDLVVLDLMLPKLHGLEVLKFIRSDVNLKATPVVVLSNAFMEGLAHKAIEAGANAGILKTRCTPARLLKIIRDRLGSDPAKAGPPSGACDAGSPAASVAEAMSEKAYCESARAELLKSAPQEVAKIRQDSLAFVKMGGAPESADQLTGLYRKVRFFTARAGLSGCTKITELASALEAQLFEIGFNLSRATPSVLQTIIQAVDCLARLVQKGDIAGGAMDVKRKVLVVDDDEICSYAIVAALKHASFDAASVKDPRAALALLQRSQFDLVLLDINMPGMNGFEVCEQLRRIPHHKTTPVIFVTLHGEFQNRARSVLCGANDLITKPISPIELALKVTIHLLQEEGQRAPAPPQGEMVKAKVEALRHESAAHAPSEPAAGEPKGRVGPAKAGVNGNGRGRPATDLVSTGGSNGALPRGPDELEGPQRDMVPQRDIAPGRSHGSAEHELEEQAGQTQKRQKEQKALEERLLAETSERERLNAQLAAALQLVEQLKAAGTPSQQPAESRGEVEELSARLAQMQAQLTEEAGQKEQRTQRLAELEQAQTLLEKQIKEHAEREGNLRDNSAAVEEQLKRVNETLAESRAQLAQEARRRAAAEDQAGELTGLRNSLEQQLAQHTEAEEQLRRKLMEHQARLEAKERMLSENPGQLEAKVQELQRAQATVAELQNKCAAAEAQAKEMKKSLAQHQAQLKREAEHRAAAEKQASELAGLRASLEQELTQRTEAEEKLRRELEEQKARLQAQGQTLSENRSQLEAKAQELQTAQATVAELQNKCAAVVSQLKGMKKSLAQNQAQLGQEAKHRTAAENQASELVGLRASLEQELTQRTEAEEKLRRELEEQKARLHSQGQTLSESRSQLEAKVQELQAAQATVAELQDKRTAVEAQLKGMEESLARNQAQLKREAESRAAVEDQVRQLVNSLRGALEDWRQIALPFALPAAIPARRNGATEAQDELLPGCLLPAITVNPSRELELKVKV